MKKIKLLLCVLLTAMTFNVFARGEGRYQMLIAPVTKDGFSGVYILDSKTGGVKFCWIAEPSSRGMFCNRNGGSTSEKID